MPLLLTILGARPQFIKAAALTRAIANNVELGWSQSIIHTGQHYDAKLSDIFFEELHLPRPNYTLQLESSERTARMNEMKLGITNAINACAPDAVLVYGDTDSTLAGAQAAGALGIPIIHIEAGLRSFDLDMPEEVNRIATDKLSSILIAPTTSAIENLHNEGIYGAFLTGDIMHDNALYFTKEMQALESKSVLLTMHRPSNVDDLSRLQSWIDAIGDWCALQHVDATFPVHPRTKKSLISLYGSVWNHVLLKKNIHAIDPVGYVELLRLIKTSRLVITDSGGIQKEAYSCETPSVVIRRNTEWVELVKAGHTVLCFEPKDLSGCANSQFGRTINGEDALYGDGEAALDILRILSEKVS
jgi:UDP-GlcNAc3NAcA epimerase